MQLRRSAPPMFSRVRCHQTMEPLTAELKAVSHTQQAHLTEEVLRQQPTRGAADHVRASERSDLHAGN